MYMIFFVLDNPDQLEEVLEAWSRTGVRGATMIESTGFHRKRKTHIPMRYLYESGGDIAEGNCTLFAIVETDLLVQACLRATEALVGDLDQPNTGVFASWPLEVVKGIPSIQSSAGKEK